MHHFFTIQNRSFPFRKKSSRNRPGSHVPIKTSRQTTYSSQHSGAYALQVWWRSVSCEARNHSSGEVLCAKSTFFLVLAVNRNDPSLPTALLAGCSTMKGKSALFSVFGRIIAGFRFLDSENSSERPTTAVRRRAECPSLGAGLKHPSLRSLTRAEALHVVFFNKAFEPSTMNCCSVCTLL